MSGYSLRDTARIFGLSPARLRYWERTALVRAGSASRGEFGFRDLVCIRTILALLERGVPVRRIRRAVEEVRDRIPELDSPAAALRVWVEGSGRVVLLHDGGLYEPSGQRVLDFCLPPPRLDDVPSLADARGRTRTIDPEKALAWFERGCQLDGRAETQREAIEAYRRAIEADPAFADAHCNLGALYQHRGRPDRARECYARALAYEAEHVEANLNLAGLLEDEGRLEAALRHYKVAIRADPLRPEARLSIALLYERLGLPRRAREHWRRYLQLAPAGAWAEIARRRLEE